MIRVTSKGLLTSVLLLLATLLFSFVVTCSRQHSPTTENHRLQCEKFACSYRASTQDHWSSVRSFKIQRTYHELIEYSSMDEGVSSRVCEL